MIKPDFWADEKIGSLQPNAKLLYIGMWNFCDDIGVTRSNPAFLKANIFPYDDRVTVKTIKNYCTELMKLDLILERSNNKESFYFVKNFTKHQKIDRPSSFRFIPDTTKHNVLELFHSSSTVATLDEGSSSNVKVKVNVKVKDNVKNVFDLNLIYQAYPKKSGKKKGIESLERIINTQDQFDNILHGSKNYKDLCDEDDTPQKYIKSFSTWVNAAGWDDEFETQEDIRNRLDKLMGKMFD
jgi:hypothetical protein